jgi:hypothetical protein
MVTWRPSMKRKLDGEKRNGDGEEITVLHEAFAAAVHDEMESAASRSMPPARPFYV